MPTPATTASIASARCATGPTTTARSAWRPSSPLTPVPSCWRVGPVREGRLRSGPADGRHEPHDAYRADALIDLAEASLSGQTSETSTCRKPSYTVLVDAEALLRGHAEPGETCEIPGVGAVPVSLLHEEADAAVWHILATDGVDIRAYCSFTRHVPTSLRVALEARDRECVVPGCNVTTGLEVDHILPLEFGGVTTYVNLARLCHHHHHEMKHRRGWVLGGGPGAGRHPARASPGRLRS